MFTLSKNRGGSKCGLETCIPDQVVVCILDQIQVHIWQNILRGQFFAKELRKRGMIREATMIENALRGIGYKI